MGGIGRFLAILAGAFAGLVAAGCTPPPPVYTAACNNTLVTSSVPPTTNPELVEVSGIETGIRNPTLWWVHNDSGGANRIYALDATGATRATVTVTGASNVDWEDLAIAAGTTSGSGVVFVGDIGDNSGDRPEIQVYRFAEPDVPTDGPPLTADTPVADVLHLVYPDGAHDAEALAVDPLTGDLWVITKAATGGTVGLYRAPSSVAAGSTTTLEKVRDIALPDGLPNAVTAVDATNDGKAVVLRTYGAVRLYARHPQTGLAAVFNGTPCTAPVPAEGQGESVAFDNSARTIVTMGEGAGQSVHLSAVP